MIHKIVAAPQTGTLRIVDAPPPNPNDPSVWDATVEFLGRQALINTGGAYYQNPLQTASVLLAMHKILQKQGVSSHTLPLAGMSLAPDALNLLFSRVSSHIPIHQTTVRINGGEPFPLKYNAPPLALSGPLFSVEVRNTYRLDTEWKGFSFTTFDHPKKNIMTQTFDSKSVATGNISYKNHSITFLVLPMINTADWGMLHRLCLSSPNKEALREFLSDPCEMSQLKHTLMKHKWDMNTLRYRGEPYTEARVILPHYKMTETSSPTGLANDLKGLLGLSENVTYQLHQTVTSEQSLKGTSTTSVQTQSGFLCASEYVRHVTMTINLSEGEAFGAVDFLSGAALSPDYHFANING